MSQTQTDEKLIALKESYDEYIGIDQRYRENHLSADRGKKVKIYESDELRQKKESGIAYNIKSFGSKRTIAESTSTSSRTSKVLQKSLLIVNLLLHFVVALLAVLAVFVIMNVLVLPVIPENFHTPAVIVSYIFTLVVIFKS